MHAGIQVKARIPEGQSGDWKVEKFTVPEFSIEALHLALRGRACPPGNYTKLTHRGAVVMGTSYWLKPNVIWAEFQKALGNS